MPKLQGPGPAVSHCCAPCETLSCTSAAVALVHCCDVPCKYLCQAQSSIHICEKVVPDIRVSRYCLYSQYFRDRDAQTAGYASVPHGSRDCSKYFILHRLYWYGTVLHDELIASERKSRHKTTVRVTLGY